MTIRQRNGMKERRVQAEGPASGQDYDLEVQRKKGTGER